MNFRSTLKVGFAACLVAGLCACATSPDDRSHRLELDTPDAFGAAGHGDSLSTAGWLADFSDPALARLVAEAQQAPFRHILWERDFRTASPLEQRLELKGRMIHS